MSTKRIDYKWIIAGLCFMMVFVSLGFFSSPRGLFIAPVTEALGIPRSAFAVMDSCRFVTTSIVNLFFGALMSRFGARKLIGAGFLSLSVASVICALATHIVWFYVAGCLLGLGFSWLTTTMISVVVSRWFTKNKGTVTGALLAANGIGGAVSTPLVSLLINNVPGGYHSAYWFLAAVAIVFGIVMVLFFRDKEAVATTPSAGSKKGNEWVGLPFSETVKKWYFYALLPCILGAGIVLEGMYSVAPAHMQDIGLDAAFVATALSVNSLILACSKFLCGFIFDRYGLRVTVSVCATFAAIAALVLALLSPQTSGLIWIYCVALAFGLPLQTVVLPLYASDLFGQRSFDSTIGLFVSVNTVGYSIGPPFLSLFYDMTGSYKTGFFTLVAIVTTILLLLQGIISAAHKRRRQITNTEKDAFSKS